MAAYYAPVKGRTTYRGYTLEWRLCPGHCIAFEAYCPEMNQQFGIRFGTPNEALEQFRRYADRYRAHGR